MTGPTPGTDPGQQLSDEVIALLRTAVPAIWGFIAAWLIQLGIPASVLVIVHGAAITGLTALATILWYALWRWASPHVPQWLIVVVLGYAANPTYSRPGATKRGAVIPTPREE